MGKCFARPEVKKTNCDTGEFLECSQPQMCHVDRRRYRQGIMLDDISGVLFIYRNLRHRVADLSSN